MANPNKLTREETGEFLYHADQCAKLAEYDLQQLPRTPGRDAALQGVEQVKRGLEQIALESQGDRG